jgi:hypothetical protein
MRFQRITYPRSIPFNPSPKAGRGALGRSVFAHKYAKLLDAQVDALVPASRLPVRVEPAPVSGEVLVITTAKRADLERLGEALGVQLDLEGLGDA